jgi:hypothetical protein
MHICFKHCLSPFFQKENVRPVSKRILDDAMFEFFAKKFV